MAQDQPDNKPDELNVKVIKDSGKNTSELKSAIDSSINIAVRTKPPKTSREADPKASNHHRVGHASLDGIRKKPDRRYLDGKASKGLSPKADTENIPKNDLSRTGKTILPAEGNTSEVDKKNIKEPEVVEVKQDQKGSSISESSVGDGGENTDRSAHTNLYMYSNQTIGEIASQLSGTQQSESANDNKTDKSSVEEVGTDPDSSHDGANSGTNKKTSTESKKAELKLQNPKTFDTTEYHLPISAKHHKKAKSPTSYKSLIILVVLMLVLATVYLIFVQPTLIMKIL